MDLTAAQLELLSNAWALSREGKGQVLADGAYPNAHALAEMGWLERRFMPDGELAWFWTREAEQAVNLAAITAGREGDVN